MNSSSNHASIIPSTNLLITSLPLESRTTLMRLLEPVALPLRTVLYEPERTPHYVHFLTGGLASIVTYMKDGEAAEVGLVAREGMPESIYLLGPGKLQTNCFMQIAGMGLRMRFRDFEQLYQRDEKLRSSVLRFIQYQSIVLSQAAACNRLHEVEERLARWLLMVADMVGQDKLHLTQEFLSQMLGTRRSTVTLVAGALQRNGFIEYTRGDVHILDRKGLEGVACECYQVVCDALNVFSRPGTHSDLH